MKNLFLAPLLLLFLFSVQVLAQVKLPTKWNDNEVSIIYRDAELIADANQLLGKWGLIGYIVKATQSTPATSSLNINGILNKDGSNILELEFNLDKKNKITGKFKNIIFKGNTLSTLNMDIKPSYMGMVRNAYDSKGKVESSNYFYYNCRLIKNEKNLMICYTWTNFNKIYRYYLYLRNCKGPKKSGGRTGVIISPFMASFTYCAGQSKFQPQIKPKNKSQKKSKKRTDPDLS